VLLINALKNYQSNLIETQKSHNLKNSVTLSKASNAHISSSS